MTGSETILSHEILRSIGTGEVESLGLVLDHAFKTLPSTRYYRRFLRNGYVALARVHQERGDYANAVVAADRARLTAPRNWNLIEYELNLIEKLVHKCGREGVSDDLEFLIAILSTLRAQYSSGKYWRIARSQLTSLELAIGHFRGKVKRGRRSPVSHSVRNTLFHLYDDLSKEQRDELVADIFSDFILQLLKERDKDSGHQSEKEESVS